MNHQEQQAKRERWKKIIEDQEISGLSQVGFCKKNNLSSAQFGYYKSLEKPKQKAAGVFSPVKINQQTNTAEIRLTLPNGFQCIFPCYLDKVQIKNFIEVLLSC